jgi:hypothetical protein
MMENENGNNEITGLRWVCGKQRKSKAWWELGWNKGYLAGSWLAAEQATVSHSIVETGHAFGSQFSFT